jgi:hypothetical protein
MFSHAARRPECTSSDLTGWGIIDGVGARFNASLLQSRISAGSKLSISADRVTIAAVDVERTVNQIAEK